METLPAGTLESFSLYLVRTSALVLGAPLFGSATGFSGYKIGLIASISFLLYTTCGQPLDHAPLPLEYAGFVLREVLIGVFLAFTLHAVVLAVRVAGELIGQEMGFNMATLLDPSAGTHTPVIAQIYETFFFIGFLAVDGHHVLLRALARSFERAPVGAIEWNSGLAWMAQSLFKQMFTAGISFAAPVIILLSLISLLTGLVARAVPQLNVQDLGFVARIAIGLVALLVFAPFLAPALESLYGHMSRALDSGLDAL